MNDATRWAGLSASADALWSGESAPSSARRADALGLFRTVLQFRWPIIAFTVVIASLAVLYVQTVQPLYRSTQTLLLESNTAGVVAVEDLVREAAPADDEGYVITQIERLRSRVHAERVIDSLELLDDPIFSAALDARLGDPASAGTSTGISGDTATELPTTPEHAAIMPSAVDYLLANLDVDSVPTTRLLRVSYRSPDPVLAARVANEVGMQYVLEDVTANRDAADEVTAWLSSRLETLKATLDESERALRDFKLEHDLVDVGGSVGSLSEQRLISRTEELTDARLELANLGFLRDGLRNAGSGNEALLSRLPVSRLDPVVQDTRAEMNRLRQELDGLSNQYGPRHPRVLDVQSRLDTLSTTLGASLDSAVAGVENEYALVAQRVAALEAELEDSRAALQDVDERTAELIALDSKVETNRELYYRFFSRLSEAESTENLDQVNAIVVERARPALEAAEPDKPFIVGLSVIGALLLAIVAALVAAGLDDSLRRPTDVEDRLRQRLLGLVPTHRGSPRGLSRVLPWRRRRAERQNRMFHEAFRSVRTRLLLASDDEERRVLLVTSSVPGEGKSMSSVCLARAFAQVERVLLIDADIRRPSLASALSLPPDSPGLTQLIAGHAALRECVRHHRENGFDVLPSGPITDQPLEMLASTQFAALLDQLARQYDRIVIDTAPVEAVSDALPIARLVDGVIYVVKSHDTSAGLAGAGLAKLDGIGAPILGVLLTQVNLAKLASYGADYEFHGYYDYYDYAAPATEGSSGFNLDRDELRRINLRSSWRPEGGQATRVPHDPADLSEETELDDEAARVTALWSTEPESDRRHNRAGARGTRERPSA